MMINENRAVHKEENGWYGSDTTFNNLYSEEIRLLSQKHWTALDVAVKAAAFLAATPKSKILDIGSGSGKFCLIAAHFHPDCLFYGVEQRKGLVTLSNDLATKLALTNVFFLNENITNIDFDKYGHFYFYNSFYENIEGTKKIDYDIYYSEKLYHYYNRFLYKKLNKMPAGTRLVTFHSFGNEIPPEFEIVSTGYDDYLKFWIKV